MTAGISFCLKELMMSRDYVTKRMKYGTFLC